MTSGDQRILAFPFRSTRGKSATVAAKQSLEVSLGVRQQATVLVDPFKVATEFPDRWSRFLKAHFKSVEHVAWFFGVTAPGAQKWWDAIGGPKGDKVALAMAAYPETAGIYLIGAE